MLKTKTKTKKYNIIVLFESLKMKFFSNLDRTYSLPRTATGASSHHQRYSHQPSYAEGYYTQDRRRNNNSRSNSHHQMDNDTSTTAMDKPDFYFMPSQRKYSGEVVRVYVSNDYNKDMKK